MVYYIIPARKGSKGLPHKNRSLLSYTIKSLPKKVHKRVIVTTDDEWMWEELEEYHIKVYKRDPALAKDTTSMREVLIDLARGLRFQPNDDFVNLYLTYPERTYEEIRDALKFYREHDAASLLCKKEIKSHPYLCMEEDGHKGKQIVSHNLYRRQDYPSCFELSHYISITKVSELSNLNKNLYNEDTIFYPIEDVIDVDTKSDLARYKKEEKTSE